jgi:pectinesterase
MYKLIRFPVFVAAALMAGHAAAGPEFVVAQDGSGDFRTLGEAIDAVKAFPPDGTTLHLKKGTYREKVVVPEWNTCLTRLGERAADTIISFDDYFDGIDRGRNSTFFTPTLQVNGDDFVAMNLTIENTAGEVGQAVALAVDANRAVFRNVRLLGNQDTLYVTGEGNRMLFDDCYVEGTTDFIFGAASAVFNNCTIHSLSNSYVTAASTPEHAAFGFVFIGARLTAADNVDAVYLGRPWRPHAQTVFINCVLGRHILPEGWHNWGKPHAEATTLYAEFGSSGPGGDPGARVPWSKQLKPDEADEFNVESLLRSEHHSEWWLR